MHEIFSLVYWQRRCKHLWIDDAIDDTFHLWCTLNTCWSKQVTWFLDLVSQFLWYLMSRWSQDGCWGFRLRRGGGGWFGLRGRGAIKRCRARPQFPQAQMPSSKEPLSAAKQDFAADLPSNVAFRQWQLTIVNLDLCQKLPSIFVKGCWIERRRKNVRFHPCLILNDLKSMCIVFAVLS